MRKIFAALVCLVGIPYLVSAATVSIEVDAGILSNMSGTALPDDTLLLLIASPSGTFAPSTANSFTSGDNVVIASFALDSANTTGVDGQTDSTPMLTLSGTAGVSPYAGEAFELRWYDGLTLASTSPTSTTKYGEFRSDTAEGIGDTSWFIPSSGAVTVAFTTTSSNETGPYPDARGEANESVTPLPEPSTYAMIGFAACGLVGMKLRQRRALQG